MLKYKPNLDYRDYLISIKREIESSDKYYITDLKVSGNELENNLKLLGILHIEDYKFNIKARYIIDDEDVEIQVNISYNATKDYQLSEKDIKDIHDCTVWIKTMMKI